MLRTISPPGSRFASTRSTFQLYLQNSFNTFINYSWFNRFSKSYIYNLKSYIYFFRILVLQFSLSILLSSYLYREAFYEFSFQDTVYLPIILQFNAELQVCVLQTVFHSEFIKLVFWSIILRISVFIHFILSIIWYSIYIGLYVRWKAISQPSELYLLREKRILLADILFSELIILQFIQFYLLIL